MDARVGHIEIKAVAVEADILIGVFVSMPNYEVFHGDFDEVLVREVAQVFAVELKAVREMSFDIPENLEVFSMHEIFRFLADDDRCRSIRIVKVSLDVACVNEIVGVIKIGVVSREVPLLLAVLGGNIVELVDTVIGDLSFWDARGEVRLRVRDQGRWINRGWFGGAVVINGRRRKRHDIDDDEERDSGQKKEP